MDPILTLGLWGQTPEVELEAARDALARGDLPGSVGLVRRRGRGLGSGRRPPARVGRSVSACCSPPSRSACCCWSRPSAAAAADAPSSWPIR